MTRSAEMVAADRPPPPAGHGAAFAFGELLLTFGLVVLLFAAYEFIGKAWEAERAQADLGRRWERGLPVPGDPIGRLHIPRLGKRWIVAEGVSRRALAKGPGHYPRSENPGEVGNVAIAGHRMPSVFWNLDRLRRGDPVVLETRRAWFVYRATLSKVVPPTRVQVVAHNPDAPGAKPTRRLLTLTTCNPKFDNYQRLIVRAELVRAQAKSAGRPPELPGR
ncbi:class E sortase [Actinomadura sp. NBRC 104412]|uniref:class E sortase n=1 Tax=Actinomadura sp. NBRC 104412 TaxID=3032203 RepID=UPI0024A19DFC|nr:class E sortase [Actinomadura sp. NBRC 104412]GLZ07213.1 class E sortase [Actinomadura sp. NBRC 104412]